VLGLEQLLGICSSTDQRANSLAIRAGWLLARWPIL
jgi:hypothetical protein